MDVESLLQGVKDGTVSVADAKAQLQAAPYLDLGYAKLDTHRRLRTGMAEVVFCQGKADQHLLSIFTTLLQAEGEVLGTRCSKEQAKLLQEHLQVPLYYDPLSRTIATKYLPRVKLKYTTSESDATAAAAAAPEPEPEPEFHGIGSICVVTAGTADLPIAEEAALTCEYFGGHVERVYDAGVAGIHRLLSNLQPIQAANCVIAVAGMEGALGSVIGGLVSNPVIAVPTSVGYGANFHGLSALLTMLNSCSNGVSTVNIDNGFGAGFIATQINRLACHHGA